MTELKFENHSPHDLVVSNLTKTYGESSSSTTVLNGLSLKMSPGDAIAVLGPSGTGKSTLLYLIGAIESPTAGTVVLKGENPWQLSSDDQARFRNEKIGFIFQDHHLLPQCTVLENVLIQAIPRHGTNPQLLARAKMLLDRVGLVNRSNDFPAQLSGGERQRVAVCRSLMNEPPLLLADEPTGNLDRSNALRIGQLLLELQSEQLAMLICVTHSPELAQLFPRRMQLRDGQLVEID